MEGSAEEIILQYIPDQTILKRFEENITEMRKDALDVEGIDWNEKTNQEFYEYDKSEVIRTLFDQYSEWEVLDMLADTRLAPGECQEVTGGPEEYNEENPYKVFYFTVHPVCKEDVLELGRILINGMKEFDVTDIEVKKYALTKSLTETEDD